MSGLPRRYRMGDGSIYEVDLEGVRVDFKETVSQFEDLTKEERESQIANLDESQALQWIGDYWEYFDILTFGKDTGEIDEAFRKSLNVKSTNKAYLAKRFKELRERPRGRPYQFEIKKES